MVIATYNPMTNIPILRDIKKNHAKKAKLEKHMGCCMATPKYKTHDIGGEKKQRNYKLDNSKSSISYPS